MFQNHPEFLSSLRNLAAALRALGRVEEANNLARAHTTPRHAQGGATAAAARRRRSRDLVHNMAGNNRINADTGPSFSSGSRGRAASFGNYHQAARDNRPAREKSHLNGPRPNEDLRGYDSS